MLSGYFHRVAKETPTRFWINIPTGTEMEQAIAAGAIACTTNPTYCARLIDEEPSYIRGVIDGGVEEIVDDGAGIDRVVQRAVSRAIGRFLPLYSASDGACGYVLIQGDPRVDDDPERIIRDALRYRSLGENVVVKIPATLPALDALECLVARGFPVCATGVFSVAQAVYVWELYQRAASKSGMHPLFFVTHVTGILDEYLGEMLRRERIDISPEVVAHAGCAVAREQYRIFKQRGYGGAMLGGGARYPHHFTEMVGGDIHVTIGWSIARSLIEADGPVVSRIDVQPPQAVLDELSEKLPDFRRAFRENGLSPEEFKDFGPFVLFRSRFLAGYARLVAEIAARRACQRKHEVRSG